MTENFLCGGGRGRPNFSLSSGEYIVFVQKILGIYVFDPPV
ncbi:hypothetical protein HanPI659440_Chr10g0396781 [Helianthus annuus]|nr:hypothetical protein HanPI659440_Chr10g0396781 [Helianthus annuus]